jgi:hypothetical protein
MNFEVHFLQETYPWHTKAPTIIIKLPIIMKPQPNITAKPRLTTKPAITKAQVITLTLRTAMRYTRRIMAVRPASTMPTSTAPPTNAESKRGRATGPAFPNQS